MLHEHLVAPAVTFALDSSWHGPPQSSSLLPSSRKWPRQARPPLLLPANPRRTFPYCINAAYSRPAYRATLFSCLFLSTQPFLYVLESISNQHKVGSDSDVPQSHEHAAASSGNSYCPRAEPSTEGTKIPTVDARTRSDNSGNSHKPELSLRGKMILRPD